MRRADPAARPRGRADGSTRSPGSHRHRRSCRSCRLAFRARVSRREATRSSLLQALQLLVTAPLLLPLAISLRHRLSRPPSPRRPIPDARWARGVGRVTAWNTAGTVAGAFLGGFVLVPQLGLRAALDRGRGGHRAWPASSPSPRVRRGARRLRGRLAPPRWRSRRAPAARLAAEPARAGRGVLRRRSTRRRRDCCNADARLGAPLLQGRRSRRRCRSTARDRIASIAPTARPTPRRTPATWPNQLLLGHLADAPAPGSEGRLHPRASAPASRRPRWRATPSARSRSPTSRRGRARGHAASSTPENRNVLADPRVRFLVADGRNALLARTTRLRRDHLRPLGRVGRRRRQPLHREFYALARSRLQPGGVMVQWFHMPLAAAGADEADRRDVPVASSRTRRSGGRTGAT